MAKKEKRSVEQEVMDKLVGRNKCQDCGCLDSPENPVTLAPDPYRSEIWDDDTEVWECQQCRSDSADEV